MTASSSQGRVALSYETIRNMTSPEEKANGSRSYFANMRLSELLKLDTAENLRGYIPDHPGKHRTQAHKAIEQTLKEKIDRFIQLSSGITVAATDIEVDDAKKVLTVTKGSIIDGAQTQGEIRNHLSELQEMGEPEPNYHARVEFMIDPDSGFIVDTAIARNTSTNIQRISMAGKKRYFDELNSAFRKVYPRLELSKKETDTGDQYVDTIRLLQVLWALMPEKLLPAGKRSTADARLKSYKNKALCLVDFERDVIDKDNSLDMAVKAAAAERYEYMVDMAGVAWKQYMKWRHHPDWAGRRLKESTRAVRRTKDGYTVADGVVFPIIAAMAQFVAKNASGKFGLLIPGVFDEKDIIDAARDQLTAHQGNPMAMGRNAAVYEALTMLTRMVNRVSGRLSTSTAA